ncbi:MAG: DNA repair protein RecO [Gammaproteobacteria bacterium]|nr:DNA repair protein RecO [Gammaproteobacteria bacterium]NND61463.1 DNA repair protein RecO [Gammaproteobacteria bacterium]
MSRHKVELQPAFLLHHYPYRETSRLLELLTRDYGRVGLVARGARSPRSKLRGILRPFTPLLVSWAGRGELGTLTAAERQSQTVTVPAARLNSGWYMNELLLRLLQRHDTNEAIYENYAAALNRLEQESAEAVVLRLFEKRLLDALGYGLQLTVTEQGQPVEADRTYTYRTEVGVVLSAAATDPQQTIAGRTLLALAAERLDDADLAAARSLLRGVLDFYLGPRPLKVREVTEAMYRHGT